MNNKEPDSGEDLQKDLPPPTGPQLGPPAQAGWAPPQGLPLVSAPRPQKAGTKRRSEIPTPSLLLIALVVFVAYLFNLAIQNRVASFTTFLATVAVALLMVLRPSKRNLATMLPLLVAIAAALVGFLRASLWVTVPSNLVVVSSLLVASQAHTLIGTGWLKTVANYFNDLFDAPVWAYKAVSQTSSKGYNFAGLLRGLLLAVVVVVPLIALLASADAVFGEIVSQLFGFDAWSHLFLTTVLLIPIAALFVANTRDPSLAKRESSAHRQFAVQTESLIVLCSIAAVLGVWCFTQLLVASGGAKQLLETADLTAAEYARRGFFQLVAATALVAIILSVIEKFTKRSENRRNLISALVVVVGLETLGLVVATYLRLSVYVDGFGYTMLRLSVAWFLGWLGLAVIIVLVCSDGFRNLAKYRGAAFWLSACLAVLSFGLFNPANFVANYNLDRVAAPTNQDAANSEAPTGRAGRTNLDGEYLTSLGSDAAPSIVSRLDELEPQERSFVESDLCSQKFDPSFLSWNRSHSKANRVIKTLDCGGMS